MAFVGTPVVTQVTDAMVRISGISLNEQTSGTIGLFGCLATPDIVLPEAFSPRLYSYQGPGHVLSLADVVDVTAHFISQVGSPAGSVAVGKIGSTVANFEIQIASPAYQDVEAGNPQIEIYIRYHM